MLRVIFDTNIYGKIVEEKNFEEIATKIRNDGKSSQKNRLALGFFCSSDSISRSFHHEIIYASGGEY